MGQFLGGAGPVVLTVEADAPADALIRIACDGRTVTQATAASTFSRILDPAEAGHACQAVVGWPGPSADRFVTWAVTNPIYFRSEDPPPAGAGAAAAPARSEALAAAPASWGVEHAANAEARVEPGDVAEASGGGAPIRLAYALAPGARASQYAALVTSDVGALSWAGWLRLRLSADRPMRVSLQLREPTGGGGARRWQRTLVVGPEPGTHRVPLAAFRPIDDASGPVPVTRVRSVLLVVDTTNTPPGQKGSVTVHEIRAES
jgi:hypothetical protein